MAKGGSAPAPPKRALVVGAASGIGRAGADALLADGWKVFGADRDAGVEDRGFDGACVCDVRDSAAIDVAVAEAAGGEGLGFVLYAAGTARPAEIAAIGDDEWALILEVNLTGAFRTIRAAAGAIPPGGSIVIVSSIDARMPVSGLAHYCAAKAGAESLVRSAALELASRGIRVNSVAPGAVRTPLFEPILQQPEKMASFEEHTPLGGVSEPQEIASVVTFLASEQSARMTGTCLVVDGGMSLREHPSLLATTPKGT